VVAVSLRYEEEEALAVENLVGAVYQDRDLACDLRGE
jgi:hypothetical protein